MKPTIFFFCFVLLASSTFAIDCSQTIDQDACDLVLNSNLDRSQTEEALSALLYQETNYPNHTFIKEYNELIEVHSAPDDAEIINSQFIKKAWISINAISPSVYENDLLYVPTQFEVFSSSDYQIKIPGSWSAGSYPRHSSGYCKISYSLVSNESRQWFEINGEPVEEFDIYINSDLSFKSEIIVKVREDRYTWQKIWHNRYRIYQWQCRRSSSTVHTDIIELEESKELYLKAMPPQYKLDWHSQYRNTSKGNFTASFYSNIRVDFDDSYVEEQDYVYSVVFEKEPYDFAVLRSEKVNLSSSQNLIVDSDYFYVNSPVNCIVTGYNHFYSLTEPCNLDNIPIVNESFSSKDQQFNLSVLYRMIVLGLLGFISFKLIKSQFKKFLPLALLPFLLMPNVFAASEECGLTNLSQCLPEAMYDFILSIINMGLSPTLEIVQNLLVADVNISLFYHTWSVIRYLLTFFYVFFFVYAGYTLMVGSASPIKRAHAKDMLKNTFIMIIMIQGSFYLYDLLISLSAILSGTILEMIDPTFFMITADNLINIGLELVFKSLYQFTLIATVLFLTIRYIIVAAGVIVLPIALLCYFIPPLKVYGEFMLSVIGLMLFITFIDLLIILACSTLIEITLFESMKILVMIACFVFVDYTLFLCLRFAFAMSVQRSIKDDLNNALNYVTTLL